MNYLLAFLPILIVILLMVLLRWGSQQAGPIAWLVGCAIGALVFGLTWDAWWVSQLKGLILSAYVLFVIWPALFLYKLVDAVGGMKALVQKLNQFLPDRQVLWLILAWAFSGIIESLTGFGIPIAIIAPMLVGIGVPAVTAVAATAIGHSWAVAFGGMGMGMLTLSAVVQMDTTIVAPGTAMLLAVGNLGCGLSVALLFKQGKRWPMILCLSILMGATYYLFALLEMISLAGLAAGFVGILASFAWERFIERTPALTNQEPIDQKALKGALSAYGILIVLMLMIGLIAPLRKELSHLVFAPVFPAITTQAGQTIPAGPVLTIKPLIYTGTLLALATLISYFVFRIWKLAPHGSWKKAAQETWRSAAPTSIGILSMVGLSTLMEHSGMTLLLAQGLSSALGPIFPLVSPLVGMLGTFTTGSYSNSNILFGPLQKNTAQLLHLNTGLVVSAQSAGSSLGGMIAPAKILVGCSTTGINGKDGEVLAITLPRALIIGLVIGVITLGLILLGH
jgi:lactate permease